MTYSTIRLELDVNNIATLTLDRTDKHNALSAQMIGEITDATINLAANPDVRALILAANGKTFCAGGDLAWMKEQMTATRLQRIAEARKLAEMLFKLNTLPMPVIGNIQGNAFGGGVGMVSVCDVAFCSKNAKFALTEARLGLIPATISPYVHAKMGETNASHMAISARILSADDAKRFGLITDVVEDVDGAVANEVKQYLRLAPKAVAASKAIFRSLGPRIDAEVIDSTIERLADTWEDGEAMEGVTAFFEKRPPKWLN